MPRNGHLRRLAALVATAACTAAGLTAIAPPRAVAAPSADTGSSSPVPALTASTFADPPASVRPKYRWWMPLAYTDDSELVDELQQMKDAGAGGAEVAAFSVEGKGNNTNPFLQTYGWGTPRWADKVATMLSAAQQRDLSLDLTIGPRWPATVPTVDDVNDPAAAQQLGYAVEFGAGGSSRSGKLPSNLDVSVPAGAEKKLVAVVAARCSDPACAGQKAKPRLLDRQSVVDLTAQVGPDGDLSYTFPGDPHATWALLAFYQLPTGQSLSGYTATGTNYVLDTLSVAGARATTDFYDDAILTPDVRALLARMRSSDLYEDSLEIGSTEKWTGSFLDEWTKRRGYSPVTVLPALTGAGDQGITSKPAFDFGDGSGARVRTDYRQTWSDLYIANRLDVLRAWAHRHDLQTRVQPYGGPIDMSDAAGHIDVPEGESLAFGQSIGAYSNVQDYKVVATGAHLAGAPVVSDECCAFSNQVFGSTVADASDRSNLQAIYRGFAGGVNQVVWHGFPYLTRGPAGAGQQEAWPGMTYGGNTSYSEAFGAKNNPSWADYRAVNDNLARLQLVLRQGRPRFDVAVYWQDFGLNGTGTTGTGSNRILASDSALAAAGYTYEYLSPAQLDSEAATYQHGELFPDASGYHAVVLRQQDTMPIAAARRLLELADSGLPVVVAGGLPTSVPGFDPTGTQDAELRQIVGRLAQQPSVVRVADDDAIPAALRQLRVGPAASPAAASSDVLSVHRQDGEGRRSVDYYYLWNQTGRAVQQEVTLAGEGRPYRLNTWTGDITPVTDFEHGDGTVTVPVGLAAHDAEVLAVTDRRDAPFEGSVSAGQEGTSAAGKAAAPVVLDHWTLDVDSWTPGASGLPGDTAHTDLGPVDVTAGPDGSLPPWSAITPADGYAADLRDVSGVGTYRTTVDLPSTWRRVRGAWLDLGTAVDTVRVAVNGTPVDGVDQADLGHVDVGPYLRPGSNTITVRVASTLLNAVRVAPGTGASSRDRMDYGLLGPVRLQPYAGVDPYVVVEPLERAVPLADGGATVAHVRVTNSAAKPAQVKVAATASDGLAASVDRPIVTVGPHAAVVVPVVLRNTGAAADGSLEVTATSDNGARGSGSVPVHHTGNLAENTDGASYPRPVVDATQDRYPAPLAFDGSTGSFLVSFGRAAGQGPTPDDPWHVGVDLGVPNQVGSVLVGGRSNYGARDYLIEVSDDGTAWRTVATVVDAPKAGRTTSFGPVAARYVRATITRAWDNGTDANVQMDEFQVYAAGR